MSNDVVVDIPIEDIRAGVRAEIDSDLGGIAAQVFEKAKSSTAFRDKTGRLRQSIWIYRSKYKDGGYVFKDGEDKEISTLKGKDYADVNAYATADLCMENLIKKQKLENISI